LTKDETWINRGDLLHRFEDYVITESWPNEALRAQINNYFLKMLPKEVSNKDRRNAAEQTLKAFPELVDYFIRYKEQNGEEAVSTSLDKVYFSDTVYVKQYRKFQDILNKETDFYKIEKDSYSASLERCKYLKHVIEDRDGYKCFYHDNTPIKRESDLHIFYNFTWFYTKYDVSHEVNDGRGPSDFKISFGSKDKTIVEFKLASNSQLKRNLEKQVEIYKKASNAKKSIHVIIFFTEVEEKKVIKILNELGIAGAENIILIDARNDNKPSASRA